MERKVFVRGVDHSLTSDAEIAEFAKVALFFSVKTHAVITDRFTSGEVQGAALPAGDRAGGLSRPSKAAAAAAAAASAARDQRRRRHRRASRGHRRLRPPP